MEYAIFALAVAVALNEYFAMKTRGILFKTIQLQSKRLDEYEKALVRLNELVVAHIASLERDDREANC